MAKITETFTAHPSSYDSDHQYYSITGASGAYAAETSSSNCSIGCTRGSVGAQTYIYFKFNTSSLNIPDGATINSVQIAAKARSSTGSTNNLRVRQMQACSGTTLKGTATSFTTNSNAQTLNVGTWTKEELADVRIRVYAERGTNNINSGYTLTFYGATLTIVYSYSDGQGQDIFYKQNGSWVPVDSVFLKQNGSWVQVEEMLVKDSGTWKS